MTLLSRVLGFVRDMIIARYFGADSGTDAFFVAFKIPNFLRRLFAEGAFAQAFVPVLSEHKERGKRAVLNAFLDRAAGTLAVVLIALTAFGVLIAPFVVWLFAPGFAWNGSRYDLTVQMLRITLPYLFFISATAFAGSLLNTFGRFAVPAFTPALLNLCLIGSAIWLAPLLSEPILALAWGVFAAGILQLAFQIPALRRAGLLPKPKIAFHDPGVRRMISRMGPAIFGVSVTQINLLVDTLFASFLVSGSVSWLYYSDRLVEFPLGLFGIAIATVILPALARNHAAKDTGPFARSLDWGIRWIVLIGTPATVGLVILAEPVLATLFQYEAFSRNDVLRAAESLKGYSLGLVAFMLIKVLITGFSSRQDLKTPLRYGVYAIAANGILNIALVFFLAHAGLALATSLAAILNAILLFRRLRKDGVFVVPSASLTFVVRVLFANLVMSAVLRFSFMVTDWYAWDGADRIVNLILWILLGAGAYGLTLLLSGLRISELGPHRTPHT